MGLGAVERCLENFFEKVGRGVGTHPIKTLVGSVVFTIACGGGFAFLSSETRPEKQWVPAGRGPQWTWLGSLALEHNDYVSATWPGNARFNFFSATCADVPESECDIMNPKYIKAFHEINERPGINWIENAEQRRRCCLQAACRFPEYRRLRQYFWSMGEGFWASNSGLHSSNCIGSRDHHHGDDDLFRGSLLFASQCDAAGDEAVWTTLNTSLSWF
eukprot:s1559_g3.t1